MAPAMPEKKDNPSFVAAMRELRVQDQQPGMVLAISTRINIVETANNDLLQCIITSTKDVEKVSNILLCLKQAATKLLSTFLLMTGSDRGWIDGLEDSYYNVLFRATFAIQGIARQLHYDHIDQEGRNMLERLVKGAYTIQSHVQKLQGNSVIEEQVEDEMNIDGLQDEAIASEGLIAKSQDQLKKLYSRLQTYAAVVDDFIHGPPIDYLACKTQYYSIIDHLIDKVLIHADNVEEYEDLDVRAHKRELVQEVEVLITGLSKMMETAIVGDK